MVRSDAYDLKWRFCENVRWELVDNTFGNALHSYHLHLIGHLGGTTRGSGIHWSCKVGLEKWFGILQSSVDDLSMLSECEICVWGSWLRNWFHVRRCGFGRNCSCWEARWGQFPLKNFAVVMRIPKTRVVVGSVLSSYESGVSGRDLGVSRAHDLWWQNRCPGTASVTVATVGPFMGGYVLLDQGQVCTSPQRLKIAVRLR